MTRGANALIRRLLKLDHSSISVDSLTQIFLETACEALPAARAAAFGLDPATGMLRVMRVAGFDVEDADFHLPMVETPVNASGGADDGPVTARLTSFLQAEHVVWQFDRNSSIGVAFAGTREVLEGIEADSVETTLQVFANIVERKRAEQRLLHDAFHDALTGLPNRTLFIEHLEQAMGRAQRANGYLFSVLFVDIDRFKVVNDSLGHVAGDELLVSFGERMQKVLRSGDVIARLGGDEFAVLADDLTELGDALRLADRIQEQLVTPFELNGQNVFVTASIGIARNAARYLQGAELLRDADIAMFRAKEFGGGRHRLFDAGMRMAMVSRLQLETELRESFAQGRLAIAHQPIIDLRTGRLAGFEALLRWHHPTKGTILPGEFIGIAEETGLIVPIGRWILEATCERLKRLNLGRAQPVSISINLTDREFLQPDLVTAVGDALRATGVAPECLHIELTEGMLLDNAKAESETLPGLKALGVHLSIDDFGTGYSSLSRLQRLPIDSLKIDHAFVTELGKREDSGEVVRTIIALAHNLGISVIAEGVEHAAQLGILDGLGCEFVQGFLLSEPVDHDGLEALADREDWLSVQA